MRYDDGVAIPDVSYSYAEAVRDGICRPVAFIPYDGTLSWQSGDDVIESSFDDVLATREASRRYRTAISTELADGLPRILRAAHERLEQVRAGGHRDAGGLVVTADGGHARRVAAALKEITGKAPVVVVHTDARAAQKLRAFGSGRERWIVAVNMVSEGVDIPRLRVGVYATAAKTPLIFRQIVGRFVRTLAGRPAELSYLFLPADRLLRMHAAEVEEELRHVLKRPTRSTAACSTSCARSAAAPSPTSPTRSSRWPPTSRRSSRCSAAARRRRSSSRSRSRARPPSRRRSPPSAPPEPAFKRRARLRAKRHGLVKTLAGFNGSSHREVNAWLNRASGVTQRRRRLDRAARACDRARARRARPAQPPARELKRSVGRASRGIERGTSPSGSR